jgi:NAD(P)-dependent dehydrogenase (short-subunit alcohol dehydrogenase family)
MDFGLSGKTAVIFGGTTGIGAAAASVLEKKAVRWQSAAGRRKR